MDNTVSHFASRMGKVNTSPSMVIASRAAALKEAGQDIISLSVGEPDFDTPDFIKEAAYQAIREGQTKYTPLFGTSALRQAVCDKFNRDNQLIYTTDQILISSGGKQGCYNLMMAIVDAGDEVIIPAPYWVSYPDMVKLADGEPIVAETTEASQYKITAEQLERLITEKTKCLVLNSPSNPTGMAYKRAELEAIGEVLRKHPRIIVLSDDIYEPILWSDEPFCNLAMVCEDLKDRVVVINGVSKAYAMTGWRIGYSAGATDIIKQMGKVQSQCSSNACSVSQAAALAALQGPQDCIAVMRETYKRRHDYVYTRMSAISGVSITPADGAFYAFANCEQAIKDMTDIADDVALCERLLEAGVAVVPGSAFGQVNCIRLSFATSDELLEQALCRIESVFAKRK